VGLRLVFPWKLLQRDQRCCQCFGENPFVVACDSLFWHQPVPASCRSLSASSRSDQLRSKPPYFRGKLIFSKATSSLGQHKEAAFTVGHVTF
jgi:hypothetical protein